jgi:hypothetical protein
MCTTISAKAAVAGSGKGPKGWFAVDEVCVGYDHPYHAPFEHAVSIDFTNAAKGPGARVAVELDRRSARALALQLLAALEQADDYEARTAPTGY